MQGHTARKRFGQNFLINSMIIADIVANVNPKIGQHIVEIGPGQGALTKGLVASGAIVEAIELDRDLAQQLTIDFAHARNFKLYSADILEFPLESLTLECPQQKLRLVGNLPYNISTPLLFKLFADINIIEDMYFMLQREVAERLIATPHNKTYGRMSVMAQYYCNMSIVIDVAPSSFEPAPKVDSSVVYFKPHANPQYIVSDHKLFQQITSQAFSQRRKTITNSLKGLITAAELQSLNIDPKLRAENLILKHYVQLTNYIQNKIKQQD